MDIYDALPEEYKNMYYATYIFSCILENNKDVNKELYLRKYVAAYITNKLRLRNKK
jgi:hypothetical protein